MANVVGSASIRITPDLSGFRAKLDSDLKAATSGLQAEVKVGADTSAAKAQLVALQREIRAISGTNIKVNVDADTTRANSALSETRRLASSLDGNRVNVNVDADTAAAIAQLAALRSEIRRADGTKINIDTSSAIGGIRLMGVALAGLVPIATSVIAALSPLVGLLGAIPGAAIGLGQSAGALKLGFTGIGAAIKEIGAAHKGAADSAVSSAKSQISSANAIKSAQESVASAVRSLANVRRDNAAAAKSDADAIVAAQDAIKDAVSRSAQVQVESQKRIQAAQDSVRAAIKDAADVQIESQRRIADAQQTLSDAHRDAARQQVDDLERISDAQRDAREAQEDLNQARRQAVEDLQDLNVETRDAALDARQAALDMARVREEAAGVLSDPEASAAKRAQAQLNIEKAQLRLEKANDRAKDSTEELAEAEKKGIEGSDRVVDAKTRLEDATKNVAKAQEDAARNREASARRIQDAEESLARVQAEAASDRQDALDKIAKAEANVVEEQEAAAAARKEALKDITKAEKALDDAREKQRANELDRKDALVAAQTQLAQAQRGLKAAHESTAVAAGASAAAAGSATKAYDKLTQAGKNFVDQYAKVKKTLEGIGETVQTATLPGFTSFLASLDQFLPTIEGTLADTGKAFGDFALEVGKLLEGPFGTKLKEVMESNNGVIRDMLGVDSGGGLLGMSEAMVNIAVAAQPLTEWIGQLVDQFGLWAKNTTEANLQNGKLTKFFETVKETAQTFFGILKNVLETIGNIGRAAFPSGSGLLKSIKDVTEGWAKWTGTPENRKKMEDFFERIKNIFINVASTIGEIVTKLTPIIDKVIKFADEHPELVKVATGAAVGGAIVSKVPGAGAVTGAVGSVAAGAATRALPAALPALANPVGLAVGATALAGLAAFKLSPDAAAMMKGSFASAIAGVKDAFKGLTDAFSKFWDKHGTTIQNFGKYWADAFGGTVSSLIKAFGKAVEIVTDILTVIIRLLTGDFKGAWQATKDLLKDVWEFIKNAFAAAWGAVIKFWKDVVWPWLKELAVTIWEAIKSKWETFKKGLSDKWHDLWETIKEKFNALKEWFAGRPSAIWGWINDRWSDLRTKFLEKWESLKTDIKEKINALKDFFTDLPGKMFGWLKENWESKIADPFVKLFQGLVDRIKGVWNTIKALFKTPINWVIDNVINKLIGGVNTLIDKVGGGPDTIKTVSRISESTSAAQGGVLPGWSPGKDIHHFYSPTAGQLHLSGGEAIMRPEWVKAVGGPQAVEKMNSKARSGILDDDDLLPGFASGGIWRPTRSGSYLGGIHGSPPAVDVGVSVGTPVHAGHGGTARGIDIKGHEPRVSHGGLGYRSYGRYVVITGEGRKTLYAHLSKRMGSGKVSGGDLIGLSGNTGNSHGAHLHFGATNPGPHSYSKASTNYSGKGTESFVDGGPATNPDDDLPGFNPIDWIRDKINAVKDAAINMPGADIFRKIATGIPKMVLDHVVDWIKDKAKGLFNFVKDAPGNVVKFGKNLVSGGLRMIGFADGGLVPGYGSGDRIPAMLSPGEFVMRRSAVDRFGSGTFDRINEASNNLPFSSPADEDRVVRKLDQLIQAVAHQPRAVYGAENVYVDTAADYQRLQQMADWAARGTRVA